MAMKCAKCLTDNPDASRFCASCGTELFPSGDILAAKTMTRPTGRKAFVKGTTLAGKYTILAELGRGGMGEVYLAEDASLDRKVAIKLLPEEMYQDPMARSRFIREAKAAAALDHPYICSIHEVGETENRLFFAMEYVQGKTMRDRISEGPLPLKQALPIAEEITEALQVAHEKGMIHRDIKPANIMLTEKGHAKVMDFGLAKQVMSADKQRALADLSVTLTDEGLAPGTPAYMSPEQLHGQALDQRSDIFSFGIVLYEMLSGVHPFKKKTGLTTLSAILSEDPRPIVELIKSVPEPLQQIIGKLLAKDPSDRYQSMKDVHADLRKMHADLGPAPKILQFLKPVRLALTAVVVVLAVIAAAWLAKVLFFTTPAKALAFQERDWILITDFDNQTGEQVFDGSLATALTVGIQQSQYVNVFPPSRIQETLKRMRRTDVKKVDETIGREIALREGIKGLLACGISKVGESYSLTARIVDPDKQTAVFSDSSRAKGKEEILGSLDELARKVRRALGESMTKISEKRMPLLRATTSSLEALKYYTGSRATSGDTAFQLLKQALELDPDFAMAHAELGLRYYIGGNRVDGEKHFQKALGLLDRLTTREKLWIRAIVEDWRGNRAQGIQNYKAYLAEYPDDSGAWYRLGYAYQVSSQQPLGVEAFKKVIEIDNASAGAYVNLATCLKGLNKDEEALVNYQKAFSLSPDLATGLYINHEYGFLLVRMGKIQEARQTFEKMMAQPDNGLKAKGYRSLGLLQMYQGKYSAAQDSLKEALILDKTLKYKLSEMREHLFLAINCNMKRQKEAFEKEMAVVRMIQKEIKIDPAFLCKIGKIYARLNRLKEAGQLLENLKSLIGDVLAASGIGRSNQSDQESFYLLKGEIALAQQQFEEALNSFGMAANLGGKQLEDSFALAYLKSGNLDKSIEKYQEFLQTSLLGGEGQELWVLAHYQLGKLYEQKGESAQASKYYERFLEIWKDADPGFPEVEDAKKRLANLKSQ
jgi:serine/threonine protein kinase/tetratricopeptide (TPR) repeat protein